MNIILQVLHLILKTKKVLKIKTKWEANSIFSNNNLMKSLIFHEMTIVQLIFIQYVFSKVMASKNGIIFFLSWHILSPKRCCSQVMTFCMHFDLTTLVYGLHLILYHIRLHIEYNWGLQILYVFKMNNLGQSSCISIKQKYALQNVIETHVYSKCDVLTANNECKKVWNDKYYWILV